MKIDTITKTFIKITENLAKKVKMSHGYTMSHNM